MNRHVVRKSDRELDDLIRNSDSDFEYDDDAAFGYLLDKYEEQRPLKKFGNKARRRAGSQDSPQMEIKKLRTRRKQKGGNTDPFSDYSDAEKH